MIWRCRQFTDELLHYPRQRFALAGFLLEMDDASDQSEVEEAWEKEIQERIQAIDSGRTIGIAYSDVMSEADQLLAR
jgi:Putative addiction module component.